MRIFKNTELLNGQITKLQQLSIYSVSYNHFSYFILYLANYKRFKLYIYIQSILNVKIIRKL
jgi:hypothetical protein